MSQDNQDHTEQEETDQNNQLPENTVNVEDAGVLKKKVTVTVPRARIDAKFNEMFGELSTSAQVPGFRPGRAPRRLIEKRFGKEVSTDVKNAMLGESLGEALDKSDLKSLGEPEIDPEKIELPDSGDMTYSFEIEVMPEFDLPKLEGIKVAAPKAEMTDKQLDDYINVMREGRATYEDTDEPAGEHDMVLAGAKITGEGIEPAERPGLQLRVAPGQVDGLPLVDLGKELTGKKAEDTVKLTVKAPASHPTEEWREKDLTVEITLSQVRKRVLPELNEEFAKQMGFESVDEFKDFLGTRLEMRVKDQRRREMRNQVVEYLLKEVKFDLPEAAVARHTASVLRKRYVDLLYQGVPREKIDENLTELQTAATEQARNDMRVSFILSKIAQEKNIEVEDTEINARVAAMAAQYNRRPERLRQELEQDGSLEDLSGSILEEKALDMLLESADIQEAAESGEETGGKE